MTMNILDKIVASKRDEVAVQRQRSLDELLDQVASAPPVRDFRKALAGPGAIRLIAEVKKASPSAQVIRAASTRSPLRKLTRPRGRLPQRIDRHAVFPGTPFPLGVSARPGCDSCIRKDFLIDEYQVLEARAAGADAILLIAEILDDSTLARLMEQARRLGMAVLVELHDAVNLPRVLASGADLVGINNRDLKHFVTDIEHTLRLRDRIPPDVVLVSESGINTRTDVERLQAAGVSAMLVGESLMRPQYRSGC